MMGRGIMKNILWLLFLSALACYSETLFEVKDASNNTVLEVATDGLRIFNQGDTLMVISSSQIKAFVDNSKALSRSFTVATSTSAKNTPNKIFELTNNDGAIFYNPSDNSDEIFSISRSGITANVNPALNRDFEINDQVSSKGSGNLMKISNESVFETVNDSTMLWYKDRNAFRIGYVLITDPQLVGQGSFASGYRSQASGKYSSAIGYYANASGEAAFASGDGSIASGKNSFAIGRDAEAKGSNSFAAGFGTEASTQNSLAIGFGCKASGDNSIALGSILTLASGDYSTAIGTGTQATGLYSTSMGRVTTAQASNSFVIGRFNALEGSTTDWLSYDPLFVIGNGSSLVERSNALEVTKAGDVGIGANPSSSYRLYVRDDYQAIRGYSYTTTGIRTYGVYGSAQGGTSTNYGIYGVAGGTGTNWAGYFSGNINVTGNVVKTSDEVKIDHPLDPENKYLSHSGVISDQMTSVYNGNVVLDGSGNAKVQLPEWFEAMNTDFKYQLTAIGAPGPNLYIARKVSGNSFEIAGGSKGMEVSWMVTAVRNDNFAKSNPLKIESKKKTDEIGYYLHPESFGLSEEKGIDYHVQKSEEEERENK
jgi:hypothetical protein